MSCVAKYQLVGVGKSGVLASFALRVIVPSQTVGLLSSLLGAETDFLVAQPKLTGYSGNEVGVPQGGQCAVMQMSACLVPGALPSCQLPIPACHDHGFSA